MSTTAAPITVTPAVLCDDCASLIANDDLSSLSADDEGAHRAAFAAYQDGEPGYLVVDGDDEDGDAFSREACHGCGTTTAGHRWDASRMTDAAPTIYASTGTHNTDPEPWADGHGRRYPVAYFSDHCEKCSTRHAPRPELDRPRAHEGNPVLIAARETWDRGADMWGQALAWLDAVDNYAAGFGYADAADAEEWGASYERVTVWHLATASGEWTLSQATDEHIEHARRVFDRMADIARAAGLDY